MPTWKTILLRSAGFGVGVAIALILVVGGVAWYQGRPKRWDESALSVVSSESNTSWKFGAQAAPEFAGFSLDYALRNNTGGDITITENVVIMERQAKEKTLKQISFATPYSSYFIPAHQKAEFSVKLDVSCSDYSAENIKVHERDPKVCFEEIFGSADGFVLFDNAQKLEIFLPKAPLK
jgi:hypothetical protein